MKSRGCTPRAPRRGRRSTAQLPEGRSVVEATSRLPSPPAAGGIPPGLPGLDAAHDGRSAARHDRPRRPRHAGGPRADQPIKRILFLIAAEHGLALVLSPWSDASAMKATAVMSAHVVARVFAAVMVLAIALRPPVPDPTEPPHPQPQPSPSHRPLTVAEWEAQHRVRADCRRGVPGCIALLRSSRIALTFLPASLD